MVSVLRLNKYSQRTVEHGDNTARPSALGPLFDAVKLDISAFLTIKN